MFVIQIMMKGILFTVLLTGAVALAAQSADPFSWESKLQGNTLEVRARIPADHYLYQKDTRLTVLDAAGRSLKPLSMPEAIVHEDEFSGKTNIYSAGDNIWKYDIKGYSPPFKVSVSYQGCRGESKNAPASCFIPDQKSFLVEAGASRSAKTAVPEPQSPDALENLLRKFKIKRVMEGGADVEKFSAFLGGENANADFLKDKGILLIILIVLGGGLLLNFTPCVLPLIPINLAIIGAGSKADSKWHGFIRGGAYGLGITIAYGVLGIFAVRGVAAFGQLNSTSYFNFTVAAIFLLLALAMFGVFNIDLSRYSNRFSHKSAAGGKIIGIFFMGIIAALLAGACVAPVLIAVLLHSAAVYEVGNPAGLLLPFLLGLGMGLPWAFAGAGLAVLPKPGRWMEHIKHAFGVIIIIAGMYYAYQGYKLLPDSGQTPQAAGENEKLRQALENSLATGKPVLIDFWASWCGVCKHMARTTLKDAKVTKMLDDYIFIKYQAEKFDAVATAKTLKYFQVNGLPTFIILEPGDLKTSENESKR